MSVFFTDTVVEKTDTHPLQPRPAIIAEDPFIARAKRLALNMMRSSAILRAQSYKRLFMPEGRMSRDAEIVLSDLRDQGFALKSTFHADPYEAARRQGRRELWLRLAQHLNLDEERVQKLVELDDDN